MYHENVTEMLAAWDRGETIWSIEMGGFGPGYEQAIQVTAVEFARAGQSYQPTGDNDVDGKAWDKLCTEVLHRIDKAVGGLSGAMYGAASWLAWQWCHNGGPKKLIERAKEKDPDDSRSIQVSNSWPGRIDSANASRQGRREGEA